MTLLEKTAPFSRESEEAVLGSILVDGEAILKVCDLLTEGEFYVDKHRAVYAAMLAIVKRGEPVQFLALSDELERGGRLDEIGGASYLTSLVSAVPSAAYVEHYAKEVKRTAVNRRGIVLAGQMAQQFYENPADPEAMIGDYGTRLLNLTEKINRRNPDAVDILGRWQALDHGKGIKLGSRSLTSCTDGLLAGEFWVIGAFSSTGKTAFALQMLREVVDKGHGVVFFSLEMSQEQLMHRMIANRAAIPMWKIRYQEHLTQTDWKAIKEAESQISDCQGRLWLYDDVYTVGEIAYLCRKHKLQGSLDVVFVDYLQNLRGNGERKDILGDGANQFLSLAKQLQCTVVALSQITTGQAMLNMGDNDAYSFKDSGAIRDAADKAIILSRDRKQQEQGAECGELLVKIKKNRTGTLGEVKMQFDFTTGRIWEVTSDRPDNPH